MNPFHLLGLSPFATGREIHRRKDDFDSAQAMGEAAWKDEFKHLLGNTPIPSIDTIAATFRRLEDPQQRIVDEFFWFWPLEDSEDEAMEFLTQGNSTKAARIWKRAEDADDDCRAIIAKHNLAIYNHLYAIDTEWQFIETRASKSDNEDVYSAMLDYWHGALERWEVLADDEDFWDIVKARVPAIGDKRLTTGFVRRMRDEFPIAFDRINGDLAVEYAKLEGMHEETERHLKYMNESHQGLDDVQATLDAIFDPVEREVDLLVREANRVRNATPHSALSAARTLLKNSGGIRKMADEMLGQDHPKRIKIFDNIARECNFCQVAYGNKTKQWEECLNFIDELMPLPCDSELQRLLKDNRKVVSENFEAYKRDNYCWFCHKHLADPALAIKIKMYGDVQIETQPFSQKYRASWRNIMVTIPRCKCCEEEKRARKNKINDAYNELQVVRDKRSGWNRFWDVETDETRVAQEKLSKLQEENYKIEKREEAHQREFPFYKELKKLGFKEGEKPTQGECQVLYDAKQRSFFGGRQPVFPY